MPPFSYAKDSDAGIGQKCSLSTLLYDVAPLFYSIYVADEKQTTLRDSIPLRSYLIRTCKNNTLL